MPTEYTADLPKTFPEFALRCARAFGATIEMRDDAPDAPIPDEFKPSGYHVKGLREAQVGFNKVSKWTAAEAEREAEKSYTKALKAWEAYGKKNEALEKQYCAMIGEVKTWLPPTRDHVEMKKFMLQQLEEGLKFDCNGSYEKPRRVSGSAYKTEQMAHFTRGIEYHTEEGEKEREQAEERTRWVRDLRESLAKWTT
jgi:hypothetical protein